MLQPTDIFLKSSGAFFLLLLALVFPFSSAFGAQKYAQIAPEVFNAIESISSNSGEKALLMNIVIAENNGSKHPPKTPNKNGTWDWGITQINDTSLSRCGVAGEQLMTMDPMPALKCALKVYAFNSKKCNNYVASLCSYNIGPGFCEGYIDKLGKYHDPRPDGTCGYATKVCEGTTTDCTTGVIGNNPYTGEFNVKRTTDVGNKGEPINCPKLRLAQDLEHAAQVSQINRSAMVQSFREDAIKSFRTNRAQNKQLYGKIFNTYCVDFKLTIYDSLARLGNWADMWWTLVDAALQYALNYVCTVAVDAINSVLAQICIPIPNIIPSFSLGGFPQTSCDGVSLEDIIMAVPGRQISLPPVKSLYEDIKRGINGQPEYTRH